MVVYPALSSETTYTRARVHALVALTALRFDAITVDHTFWFAGLIWIAEVLWYTAAHTDAVMFAASGVRATFAGVAGILWCLRPLSCCKEEGYVSGGKVQISATEKCNEKYKGICSTKRIHIE